MVGEAVVLTGLAAGAAVYVAGRNPARTRLASIRRRPGSGGRSSTRSQAEARWRTPPLELAVAAGALAVAILGGSPAAGAVVLAVGLVVASRRRKGRARAVASARRSAVIELCGAMTAELRAGRAPAEALELSADVEPLRSLLTPALLAARLGGDVAAALRDLSRLSGAEALSRLAACWSIASGSGAGLAAGLDRLAESLRRDDAIRREIASQVASPRATARMLACLPAFALLLAAGTGADPLQILLHTPVGLGCLTIGMTLGLLGLFWSERMISKAESRI